MTSNTVVLKDISFLESQASIIFSLKNIKMEDQMTVFYFDVSSTFEKHTIVTDFVMFSSDMKNLKYYELTSPVSEIYFIEPDINMTIIDFGLDVLSVYVNLDSDLRHSNMSTESGLAIKLNTTKDELYSFLAKLSSLGNNKI